MHVAELTHESEANASNAQQSFEDMFTNNQI